MIALVDIANVGMYIHRDYVRPKLSDLEVRKIKTTRLSKYYPKQT